MKTLPRPASVRVRTGVSASSLPGRELENERDGCYRQLRGKSQTDCARSEHLRQAFLQNRLPELAAHVDAHVAHLTDALKKEARC